MKTSIFVSAISLILIYTPAANAETFNGPYTGVAVGYNNDDIGLEDDQFSISKDAATFSAFAGYNYKLSVPVVIGVEADIGLSADDQIRVRTTSADVVLDPRFSFSVSARAGYLVSGKTLVYVRGGYHSARVRITATEGPITERESGYAEGWQAGGGVEHAVNKRFSARLEYKYADLEESGLNFDRHQVLVGGIFHF